MVPLLLALFACALCQVGVVDFLAINGNNMAFFRNVTQSFTTNTQITTVAFCQHGTERDASSYFTTMQRAVNTFYGSNSYKVYVIAPWFPVKGDTDPAPIATNQLYWDDNDGWKEAGESTVDYPTNRVSSFACLDALITACVSKFPNLQYIQIAGHSAGGQVVVRYALSNLWDTAANRPSGIQKVLYTVANPSSFPYLTADRPVINYTATCQNYCVNTSILATTYTFAVPPAAQRPTCTNSYNRWKYGLTSTLPAYLNQIPVASMTNNFYARNITYLNGMLDTCNENFNGGSCPSCSDNDLDSGCSARVQGWCRLERGWAFYQYIKQLKPTAPHKFASVPDVAHTARGMFTSTVGINALFNDIP